MAKTNKIVTEGVQTDYTSVIVSCSNGIDSTGALYWALREFPKEKIFLLYCDTGFEYPENIRLFYRTAAFLGIHPVLLQHPKGFLNLLLEERFKWPDMKNRWCTAYLKTGITNRRELFDEILDERVAMLLSEQSEEIQKRGRMTADMTDHFAKGLEANRKKQFEELVNRIIAENGEEGRYLYLNGVYDGVRTVRWLLKV